MATELQTEQGNVRVPTGTWHVDPAHSSVEFEVKHMMIATVHGRFREFNGTIEAAEDINDSRVYGKVTAASIDTNDETRDAHLRSADFLDVAKHPEITFESTHIEPLGGPEFRMTGDLTIKGVTRTVELDSTVEAPSSIRGETSASASASAVRSIASSSVLPGKRCWSPAASSSATR
jgi:polyisoprenoid-binding protein YceI